MAESEATAPSRDHLAQPVASRRSDSAVILSPSSPSTPRHTALIYPQDPPIELVRKPDQAYFSPYRLPASPSSPSSPSTASTATIDECCAPQLPRAPRTLGKMGLSKTQRICVLLAIDSGFFLVELTVGRRCSISYHLRH